MPGHDCTHRLSTRADGRDESNFIALADKLLPSVLAIRVFHVNVIQVDSDRTARDDTGCDARVSIFQMSHKVFNRHRRWQMIVRALREAACSGEIEYRELPRGCLWGRHLRTGQRRILLVRCLRFNREPDVNQRIVFSSRLLEQFR